jgi:FkbH-like protein
VKLIDALEIRKRSTKIEVRGFDVLLACGFTPLHLQTFLAAELSLLKADCRVSVHTGLFGDLTGNIERAKSQKFDGVLVVIEWADLDPRLSARNSGSWRVDALGDVEESLSLSLERIENAIRSVSKKTATLVCMPTLPLPPLFTTSPNQAGGLESKIYERVFAVASQVAELPNVKILSPQFLHENSLSNTRFDLKSEITVGFPYSCSHASVLAEQLAKLLVTPAPKKGLITDLDGTLWSGIVGEDGVDGISWDLEHKTQMHGLYQQTLASLASTGVLLGVASKNSAEVVERAFERRDLLVSRNEIYPFEIHWSPKSESVKRILEKWNVSADSIVFVDDSAMEVAEVKVAFPEMECILFPSSNFHGTWDLLKHLRLLFGKANVLADDALRLESIRRSVEWRESVSHASGASLDDFLKLAKASISFDTSKPPEVRAFELINKTNQFNLNGRRYTEAEWSALHSTAKAFSVLVSYEDRYGRMGKIAVMAGKLNGGKIHLDSWVLSCRAFSRRIEYQCLKFLFDRFGCEEIIFDYTQTSRNSPLQEFFVGLLGKAAHTGISLSREFFDKHAPALYHEVKEYANV